MARPAKIVEIYSNLGEVVEMTVNEFKTTHGVPEGSRRQLYNKSGWMDADGVQWRIGECPEVAKTYMSRALQGHYNIVEQDLLIYLWTGVQMSNMDLKAMKTYLLSYNNQLIIKDEQKFSNLLDWIADETVTPSVNLETFWVKPEKVRGKGYIDEQGFYRRDFVEHNAGTIIDKFIIEAEKIAVDPRGYEKRRFNHKRNKAIKMLGRVKPQMLGGLSHADRYYELEAAVVAKYGLVKSELPA